jgi:PAS domain S-box-containing protein
VSRSDKAKMSDLLRIAGTAAKLGGWYVDLTNDTVQWSAETRVIHDVAPDFQPTMEEALAFYAPEYQTQIRTAFERCITDGKPFDEVLQFITGKGKRLWARSIGEAVKDDDGQIVALHGAFQDISELIAARERSASLARQLEQTLANISDGFMLIDHDWCFGFMNTQAETLLQRQREDLLGKYLWDEFPAARDSDFRLNYELAVSEQRTVRFTEYYPEPLNIWFDVSAFPTPDGLAVYFRDVTERVVSEEALRISDERFNFIAKATKDVVWDWDFVTDTIWWNDNLLQVFGHGPEAMAFGPASWSNNIHSDDRTRVINEITAVIESSKNSWHDQYRFMHADGSARTVADRGYVIRNTEGHAIRMVGSMMDITDSIEMDERLRQAQKLEAVGQLTGGVAHDFNNLLTVILGNAELLTEQLTDQQQLRMLAEMTATAAERGAELTNRLLAFSRRQPLDPQNVNINKLIQSMDSLLRRTLPESIDIETVYAGGLWLSEVDPGQLEGALLNLAINARDAMTEGGKLTIETGNAVLDQAYADAQDEVLPGQYVMVSVSDSGTGMTPDIVSRAFEPFFTTKQIGKGSGLGLSMVFGFAKQSGGHVKIYSEVNEGTTVKLYLPRAVSTDTDIFDGHLAPAVEGGTENILVVEDDPLVREHVTGQLQALGYQVHTACNADEARDILKLMSNIELLFTDIVMPGTMNGRQLADLAQAMRPGIKVLFTSGYTENAIVHHGRLDRGVHLLNKPYRRQELAAKVRKVLDDQNAGG